jgi:hypothetical protein
MLEATLPSRTNESLIGSMTVLRFSNSERSEGNSVASAVTHVAGRSLRRIGSPSL